MEALLAGRHANPFGLLGPQPHADGVVVRAFVPGTAAAWLCEPERRTPMNRLHPDGFFEIALPGYAMPFRSYRIRFQTALGHEFELQDPYCFPSTLSDFDLHLLGEGTHYHSYERLGAHVRTCEGVRGTTFAVWAPNALRVSLVGDFNHWDGRRNPLRLHPGIGVWDIFMPGVDVGAHYKFEMVGPEGELLPLRTDPYGFRYEVRPRTASIVCDIEGFAWGDGNWMNERRERQALDRPILAYEVHLGSWVRDPHHPERLMSYQELGERLVAYVKEHGFTHVQLMPIGEYPYDGSWGYQSLGYYAPTSRFGEPQDFMAFVDHCHRNDIGVLLDWVPAHFPRDEHGLRLFDGTALYEHADPRQGEHPEWGTMVFNYGRHEVANYLIGSALFWLERYHVDGIRVDAVASMLYLDYGRKSGEWVPNQYGNNHNLVAARFIQRLNDLILERHPDVLTVAEESTSWRGVSHPTADGGLGFTLKWNMGWMNDSLRYLHRDPVHRRFHHDELTFSLVYAFHENFMLALSHDEVVHGKGSLLDKMPGDAWQKFANLRLLFGYMWAHPGKKLLFMGGEFGQWQEWRYYQSLDWHLAEKPPHEGVQKWVRELNRLARTEPSLHEVDFSSEGFEWIDLHDRDASVISFLRKARNPADSILVVCNFTPATRLGYPVGAPKAGTYRLLFNSDAKEFGGSGVGAGELEARPEPQTLQNRPFSIPIDLPPLAAIAYRVPR